MAGVLPGAEAAAKLGMDFLPGIEITAVLDHKNMHLLGYFLDPAPPVMGSFLKTQQEERIARARKMSECLAGLGVPIDIDLIVEQAVAKEQSVSRPLLARALVKAGYASSQTEAFNRWIGDSGPAYVPCQGSSPADVIRLISRAGGVSAIAHPGQSNRDHLIPSLAKAGLTALEVYHPGHNTTAQSHYRRLSTLYDLAICGGSDFHGDSYRRASRLGSFGPPREAYIQLLQRLVIAHSGVQ